MKFIFWIFLFLSLNFVGQNFKYSFIDPCTGSLKELYVPKEGVTVNYYKQIKTFQPNEMIDGTFISWANSVVQNYGGGNPCGSIIGIGSAIDIGQQTAINTINLINSISSIADFQNSLSQSVDGASGSLNITSSLEGAKSTESKKDKKQSNNTDTEQNTQSSNDNTNNSSDVQGGQNQQEGQITQNSNNNTENSNTSQNNQNQENNQQNGQNSSNLGQNGDNSTQNSNISQSGNPQQNGQTYSNGSNSSQGGTNTQSGLNSQSQNNGTNNNNDKNNQGVNQSNSSSNGQGGTSNSNSSTQSAINEQGGSVGSQNQSTQVGGSSSEQDINQGQSGGQIDGQNGGQIGSQTDKEIPKNDVNVQSSDNNKNTNVMGGVVTSIQRASGSKDGGKPSILLSSDLTGFNFKQGDVSYGGKGTMGYTQMRWDGLRTHGIMADYTSVQRGPNVTAFYAIISKKRIDLLSTTMTASFLGRGSLYGTLAVGQMWTIKKNAKLIYLITGSFGKVYKENFKGTAVITGGMYDLSLGKRIDMKMMGLFIYAPFISYYNDIVLKSPYVVMPVLGTNIKITKNFKFNINFGGAYAINENVMNFTIMCGTRLAL